MLLDCAHAFHASCLAALERHLGAENRRCALCRRPNAKHVTKRAARDRRAAAATVLTGAARARLAVKRTDRARRAFYGAGRGEGARAPALISRAPCAPTTTSAVGASDDALDALFAESDDAVAAARAVLAAAVAPPRRRSRRAGTAVRRRLGGGGGGARLNSRSLRRAEEEAILLAVSDVPSGRPAGVHLRRRTRLPCSRRVPRGLRLDALSRGTALPAGR